MKNLILLIAVICLLQTMKAQDLIEIKDDSNIKTDHFECRVFRCKFFFNNFCKYVNYDLQFLLITIKREIELVYSNYSQRAFISFMPFSAKHKKKAVEINLSSLDF